MGLVEERLRRAERHVQSPVEESAAAKADLLAVVTEARAAGLSLAELAASHSSQPTRERGCHDGEGVRSTCGMTGRSSS
jgi:hypothetical protein